MPVEKAAEARFWDRYIQVLKQAKVPKTQRRWYVVRVSAGAGTLAREI